MDLKTIEEYRRWREGGSLEAVVYRQTPPRWSDRLRAEEALRSENPIIAMEGCIYLLTHSELSAELLSSLEQLFDSETPIKGNLLLGMRALPVRSFVDHPQLGQFVFAAAEDADLAMNAAILIGKLAGCGHSGAIKVFQRVMRGSDAVAAKNAQLSFAEAQKALEA